MADIEKILAEIERLLALPEIGFDDGSAEHGYKVALLDIKSFIKSHTKEPVSEDLEEAAIQFATDTETGKVDVVKQSSFFWGAIYHKQQMMAKAIDALVHTFDNGYIRVGTQLLANNKYGLKVGDKVKVIVIKED